MSRLICPILLLKFSAEQHSSLGIRRVFHEPFVPHLSKIATGGAANSYVECSLVTYFHRFAQLQHSRAQATASLLRCGISALHYHQLLSENASVR